MREWLFFNAWKLKNICYTSRYISTRRNITSIKFELETRKSIKYQV